MQDDEKRVAMVTGGNRGIGLEICRQLSRLGHRVVVASRDGGQALEAGTGARRVCAG